MDKRTQKIIAGLSEKDFDGHTSFSDMNAEQRLDWLEKANATYLDFRKYASPPMRVADSSEIYRTKNAAQNEEVT